VPRSQVLGDTELASVAQDRLDRALFRSRDREITEQGKASMDRALGIPEAARPVRPIPVTAIRRT
jgi:hypothetical protein